MNLTAEQLASLKELYSWHKRQAEHCATQYTLQHALASEKRFMYLKAQTLHINAVAALMPVVGEDYD